MSANAAENPNAKINTSTPQDASAPRTRSSAVNMDKHENRTYQLVKCLELSLSSFPKYNFSAMVEN